MVFSMRMFVYDLANRLEAAVSSPEPGKLTRMEKQALSYMGAAGYRVASEEFDAPLLKDTQEICKLYGMPDMGKVVVYEHKFPNASYMRESSTMFISTALLEMMDRDERRGVVAHEIAHRSQRNYLKLAATTLIVASVVAASYFTTKFKNSFADKLRKKVEDRAEESFLYKTTNKFATAVERAPWAVNALYGLIGFGVNWLLEIPQAAIQRHFELDADKQAAEKLRNPEALANALEKISATVQATRRHPKQIAPTDPEKKGEHVPEPAPEPEPSGFRQYIREIKQSHPPVEKRVALLREMAEQQRLEGVSPRV